MTLNDLFGANVRQHRRVKGLTQAQLAEAVDLSVEMVGKIERGTSSPRAVQRSLHELIFGEMVEAAEGVAVAGVCHVGDRVGA